MMEYDSTNRPPPIIDEFIQLIHYRDLVFIMIESILKNRYKRSILGVFWMLLNPLLQTIVLTIAFGIIFKSSLPNYVIYLLSGLLAWNFITQTTQHAMSSMAYGGGLLKRIYIPRATYVVAAVGSGLINLIVSIGTLFIMAYFTDHTLAPAWLFLPFSIAILSIFSLGFALLLSTLAVFFTDTIDIYQVLIQALFFLTPVMYPPSILPPELHSILGLNPFVSLIDIFRVPIYYNHLPSFSLIINSLSFALLTLVAGWALFTNKADQFAYHL